MTAKPIYVLVWANYSGGCGVVRAYEDQADAEDDLVLIKSESQGDKVFEICPVRIRPSLSKATGEKQ